MRLLICLVLALLCAGSAVESQRVRYGPGVCGPIDPTYSKIATETGGQPYPMGPEELGKSASVMGASSSREMILWASGERENSYVIPVDSTMTRMIVSGTFDGTGGTVMVTSPNGGMVAQGDGIEDTQLHCGRIIIIDAPAAGDWQVRVTPTSRFWLRVKAKTDVALDAEFVEPAARSEPDRLVPIQGQPITGRAATLRVSLAVAIANPTFHLVSLDARPLQPIDLQSPDGLEFRGQVGLPHEAFRVMVSGRDQAGHPVQRVSRRLFHGEAIEIIPPAGETAVAGTLLPVTFTIKNHGPAGRVTLVAVDGKGKVVAVEPPVLDIGAGGEGIATIRLRVPSDDQQSEASIRLTATAEGRAAVGGFNSAGKTFTVISR